MKDKERYARKAYRAPDSRYKKQGVTFLRFRLGTSDRPNAARSAAKKFEGRAARPTGDRAPRPAEVTGHRGPESDDPTDRDPP